MTSAFSEFFKHNLWANLQLLDVCAQLDTAHLDATVPGTYGSLEHTWLHLVAAEGRYLALLRNRQPTPGEHERDGFPGWPTLRERLQRNGAGLTEVATTFDSTLILQGTRNGEAYTIPAIVPMLQAINHATEHRTQIATILTQQGIEPPSLDGWQYGETVLGTT